MLQQPQVIRLVCLPGKETYNTNEQNKTKNLVQKYTVFLATQMQIIRMRRNLKFNSQILIFNLSILDGSVLTFQELAQPLFFHFLFKLNFYP